MDKKEFLKEIQYGFKINKDFSKGGYSTYGDRTRYIIKIIKKLNTSEDIRNFEEALFEFLKGGERDSVGFIMDILIDSVHFGNLIK